MLNSVEENKAGLRMLLHIISRCLLTRWLSGAYLYVTHGRNWLYVEFDIPEIWFKAKGGWEVN